MMRKIGEIAGDIAAILVILAFLPLWLLAWMIGGRR